VGANGGACVGALHCRDGESANDANGDVFCDCATRDVMSLIVPEAALSILRVSSCGA
jgi:hypothetical protein